MRNSRAVIHRECFIQSIDHNRNQAAGTHRLELIYDCEFFCIAFKANKVGKGSPELSHGCAGSVKPQAWGPDPVIFFIADAQRNARGDGGLTCPRLSCHNDWDIRLLRCGQPARNMRQRRDTTPERVILCSDVAPAHTSLEMTASLDRFEEPFTPACETACGRRA
jgi:hypothetical protein